LRGVAVGPFTPGFVGDANLALRLAEIGVILLMFGVGLKFSLEDLWSVRLVALPGAIVQMSVATGLGCVVGTFMGLGAAESLMLANGNGTARGRRAGADRGVSFVLADIGRRFELLLMPTYNLIMGGAIIFDRAQSVLVQGR
jgi:hypothetical protein